MANNRYLEVVKRLLSAEMYFRSRRHETNGEPPRPTPGEQPNSDRITDER